VGAAASAKLLAAGAAWRLTGASAAGDTLVTAVTTGGETERTLAGMLLVRAGDRSVRVVTNAILADSGPDELVDVLVSIGTDQARAALLEVAQAPPAAVPSATRETAAEGLRTLDEIRRQHG
jgi:hypothetical protein